MSGLRLSSFRKRLDAFSRELSGVEEDDVESLHRMRVASRRLRELVPLLGLDRDTTRTLVRRLRKVTRALGSVRDLDILRVMIRELQGVRGCSPAALKQVSDAVADARAAARERMTARLPIKKLARIAHRLRRAVSHVESDRAESRDERARGLSATWRSALDARLARRAARARMAIEAAGVLYVPEHLHDVRIALKKLRYTAEFSREVRPRESAAGLATLRAAQDQLGRLHDREMLVDWLRRSQTAQSTSEHRRHAKPLSDRAGRPSGPLTARDANAWREIDALVRVLGDRCRRVHAQYVRERAALLVVCDRCGARRGVRGRKAGAEARA